MFKIGEGETKISVTTRNGSVRMHFRKFYQSKFNRKKFYPSKQGNALTLKEWNDLKTLITQVDEAVDCTKIMLDDVKEESTLFHFMYVYAFLSFSHFRRERSIWIFFLFLV